MFLNTALAFFFAYLWGWNQALTCPSVEMPVYNLSLPWLLLPDAEKMHLRELNIVLFVIGFLAQNGQTVRV